MSPLSSKVELDLKTVEIYILLVLAVYSISETSISYGMIDLALVKTDMVFCMESFFGYYFLYFSFLYCYLRV